MFRDKERSGRVSVKNISGYVVTSALGWAAIISPAYAQSDNADEARSNQQLPTGNDIIVTGSRIARSDFVAESPILTVDQNALMARGPATLEATFNQLPQFAASNANSGSSPARQGRANANLRGLGIQRTLVLLDGRRIQPSDSLGAVDLNVIAPSLIESVEIISGGASAVYGSDAIAGVVNVRLRRNFEGVELDAQQGITSRGDGPSRNLSLAAGGKFAGDRGQFMASVGYFGRGGTYRASRPFFEGSGIASALPRGVISANAGNLPSQAELNRIFANYGVSANVPRNASLSVNADGSLFTTSAPVLNLLYPAGNPYVISEGRVGFALGETLPLITPMDRYSGFFRASFEITPDVEIFAQFNHVEYSSRYSRPGWSAGSAAPLATIPVTNPFIPDDLRDILASRPDPDAPMNFVFSTSRVGDTVYDFSNQVTEAMVGLRGNVPSLGWTWEIYGSRGHTKTDERVAGFVDIAAWRNLVNAADGGASICAGGFNPFSPVSLAGAAGQEGCHAYLNRDLFEQTRLKQSQVEANVQGGLFHLPAGDVRFAAGANYRKASYDYAPDNQRVQGTVWPVQLTGPTSGDYSVWELFAEASVPLLSEIPLIERLTVDGAFRYSDYSTVGSVTTYKASVDWAIDGGLRARGSYQRAIRAPSLGELYSPPERASAGIGSIALGAGDPCDVNSLLRNGANSDAARVRTLCIAQGVPDAVIDLFTFAGSSVPGEVSGNLNLKEETADTATVGLIWQSRFSSPFLRNLSLSVDYYNIRVKDAIGTITAQVGLSRCFNADGKSNPTYDPESFFCQLTSRNISGGIERQVQSTLNLAAYQVSGVDFQADWALALDDLGVRNGGRLSFNAVVAYLDRYKIQNREGAPFLDYAGTIGNTQIDAGAMAFPKWKFNLSTTYSNGPVDLTIAYRSFSDLSHYSDVGVANPSRPGSSSKDYVDLSARVKVGQKSSLRFGVQNLFDTQPAEWVGYGATDLGLYDIVQRRYFIGIRHGI
jgi:iron complex outermembrane receptor protein